MVATTADGRRERDIACVLQGPYAQPPYLPPVADPVTPSQGYYAVATIGELAIDLEQLGNGTLTLFFKHHSKKVRPPPDRLPTIHEPLVLTADSFRKQLSAPSKLLAASVLPGLATETAPLAPPSIVWGTNRDTGKLSWFMMVIEKRTLLRFCKHSETVETLARMGDYELDAKMADLGSDKVNQVMAVYTRHLQLMPANPNPRK